MSQQTTSQTSSNKLTDTLTCMFVTANVGTIFEESALFDPWFDQLKHHVSSKQPQFIAMHCQEVGGKNYETSMKNMSSFIDKFLKDDHLSSNYDKIRIFFDTDFECLERFTALGSIYLVHKQITCVKLYNFITHQMDDVQGRRVFTWSKGEQNCEHVEKVKFPQNLYPDCRSSRKGFMRVRWLLNDHEPLDMVNIHLFHDASNIIAMQVTPSPYAQSRQKALDYTLEYLQKEPKHFELTCKDSSNLDQQVPLFIFGDFNFRLDTNKVISKIAGGASPVVKRSFDNKEVVEIVYRHPKDERNTMTVGKKTFDCLDIDTTFRDIENTKWLLQLDNELEQFKTRLHEFDISFSPSYPFKEDESGAYSYMKTRCPAWCDRVLFNMAAKNLVVVVEEEKEEEEKEKIEIKEKEKVKEREDVDEDNGKKLPAISKNEQDKLTYTLLGDSVPMGDHKPVLLYCKLNFNAINTKVT